MMVTTRTRRLALACLCLSLAVSTASGQKASRDSDFIRFRETGEQEGVLETAIARFTNKDGVTVDLVAAVHIADRKYYEDLNKRFKNYEVVLYEMIKPKKADPASRGRGGAITFLQRTMKNVLDLHFQLDGVDYTAKNFVHADMDPGTFAREQELNDESLFKLLFRSVLKQWKRQMTSKQESMSFGSLLSALLSDDSSRALKYLFARELKNAEEMLAGLGGEKGTVIVEGRNKVAMKVLHEQIEAGKKKVAIFYGGGHMPDLEKRLVKELAMKKTGQEWLPAWDIHAKKPAKAGKKAGKSRRALREL